MTPEEKKELERAIAEITEIAEGFGLDFYPMRYEICPADIIYTFGAYGMPTRYSHWSFGKSFHKMKLQYDLGLSKIYELVINSNPCYAFLLEGNSLIQNKLIVAHVLAHCDFFKNNIRFSNTSRDMVESMAASAERIRAYEIEYGKYEVEKFLDAVLAIQEHIDPSLLRPRLTLDQHKKGKEKQQQAKPKKKGIYDDLWALEELNKKPESKPRFSSRKRFPEQPEKDLMLFLEEHSPELEDWQRDIMTMLREEMLYFWPQLETKIMNEGWASYWHVRILRELDLSEEEAIEFAKLNASVLAPSRTSINPYYLGYKMFEDIEKRWDNPAKEEQERFGRKPGQGRNKIFEVREMESDISFLRNYLTKELVEELDLYVFQRKGNEYTITDKDWEQVRDQLVSMRINGGFPYIMVEDADYGRKGELMLKHYYEGIELDLKYLEKTLPYVYQLWGRPVHLQTVIDNKHALFSYDGERTHRRFL
ncbi:SpoVR family protein [Caldalkalibacillus thermarum TA2.A1]|uniref:SpoVR family protein n=1 Tax=Caldalkalibacillus thermarum (strain TA2.A1) TaxID=986075 RepID=F5L780_CALTT|nr:SpoVR family protein [Caldalkalibacillus thermarum]EGL82801.1 SpoVR family protein [Caldalkalibacillus thermarum TA2.A1]QZT34772.1 SpoVR family protein [Caldalkalibacillus thermarum TA2.A1]